MVIAIVHAQSQGILGKFEATTPEDAGNQFIKSHPEYECDTLAQFYTDYPQLAQNLLAVPLH